MKNFIDSHLSIATTLGLLLLAPSTEGKPRDALSKVFERDMLTADLAYLEHMIGPAKRTYESQKEFVVGGCNVTVTVENGSIQALALQLTPRCTFDPNKFLTNAGGKLPSANKLTFGQFDAATGGLGQFMSYCVSSCGNIADPIVSEFWKGSHDNTYLEVELDVTLVSGPALEASGGWVSAMEAGEGQDWVRHTKFNCSKSKYDQDAHRLFKSVQIDAITIGYNLQRPKCGP